MRRLLALLMSFGAGSACIGNPCYDDDDDGYPGRGACADDCDDHDPSVHPGAADPKGDGKDSDCDGVDGVFEADAGAVDAAVSEGDAGDDAR